MPKKLLFESETCSRCAGSGQYSYCQSYGSTCFKCHGAGMSLTKRGHAAQLWLNARKMVSTASLKIGERIWSESIFGNQKLTITKIEPNEKGGMNISGLTEKGEESGMMGFTEVRKVFTLGELSTLKTEALAFQATLTKSGTVLKRKAASPAAV
jgi:hypothetical protein